MKESKRAIEEVFRNEEFAQLMKEYYSGDLNPYTPEEWPVNDSWSLSFDRFPMNDDGAADMIDMRYNQKDVVTVNTTFNGDTQFSAMSVDKKFSAIFFWFLNLIEYDYEDIKLFNAYDYDRYNEWKTINSDDNF